jgi:hypothetical protein
MRFVVFVFAFLLAACSAPDSGLHADLGKLRPWSSDISSEQPLPPPFVADFESGARSLSDVAVEPTGESDSPSMSLLQRVMDERHYGVVVVEGIPRSMGIDPSAPKAGYTAKTEIAAAIQHAQAKKIPFVGAEPDESLILSAARDAGYSPQDLYGLYVLRLIPQWRRDGTLTRESFAEAYKETSAGIGARVGIAAKDVPGLQAFEDWYRLRQGSAFRLHDINTDTAAPVPEGTLFSQKLAAVTDRVRSVHILRVTEEMLNRYHHVLLVFNSKHYPVQEPALESMLGPPTRISDQP